MVEKCALCASSEDFKYQGVEIVDGSIYQCNNCKGYFLHPPVNVEYNDSGWTTDREDHWKRDIGLANQLTPKILKYAGEQLGRPIKTVFEIGCGSGFMGVGFKNHGCDYTGIDVDQKSIQWARDKGVDAYCTGMEDVETIPEFRNANYDLIISSNVFEHVQDISKSHSNLHMLGKNSLVVTIVPNGDGLFAKLKKNKVLKKTIQKVQGNKRDIVHTIDGYWHNVAYTKQTLSYFANKFDIEEVSCSTIGVNDPIFGFVQPNPALSYRISAAIASILDMRSQILFVGILK